MSGQLAQVLFSIFSDTTSQLVLHLFLGLRYLSLRTILNLLVFLFALFTPLTTLISFRQSLPPYIFLDLLNPLLILLASPSLSTFIAVFLIISARIAPSSAPLPHHPALASTLPDVV